MYNGRCGYCSKIDYLTIDHILPVSKGGTGRYENVIPACEICNKCKEDMDLQQFRTKIALLMNVKENLELLNIPHKFVLDPCWETLLDRFKHNLTVTFWYDKH
jgi:hypothetical protein